MGKFSIGMAVFDDFNGVYFTTQSLKIHHPHLVGQIVVVDNNSDQRVKRYCHTIGATYVDFPTPKGTAAPRDAIFAHATQDRVVVIDSHVLLHPGCLDALDAEVTNDDLYHGPLMYDWGQTCATHMDDIWRGEMWGIWGVARQNKDGSITLAGADHKTTTEPTAKFEIPAHGMGMWACRRDSWLGFNKDFREFGGEEWYIHEKYRKAGRKVWCVPGAKWGHRFSDLTAHPIPYPLTRLAKVRNYCIGHKELGLPLNRIYQEFVSSKLITERDWEMACGCAKPAAGAPPVTAPAEITALKAESVIDFTGATWDSPTVARPQDPTTCPMFDCDLLCLGAAPYALGRWAGKAQRIAVAGGVTQVAPFLLAHREYTVLTDSNGWVLMSRRAEDKKEVVGIVQSAGNALKALGRAMKASMTGLPLVSEATQEARLEKCIVCPHRTDERCSKCGCFVAAKTWVATEQCPDDPPRWGKV